MNWRQFHRAFYQAFPHLVILEADQAAGEVVAWDQVRGAALAFRAPAGQAEAHPGSWEELPEAFQETPIPGPTLGQRLVRGVVMNLVDEDVAAVAREGGTLYRGYAAETRRSSDQTRTTVIINTDDVDSYRTIVDPAGGEWDLFQERFFINHDNAMLAGRSPVPRFTPTPPQWIVNVDDSAWDHEDDQVERWFRKVKSGLCNSVSVGFQPLDGSEEMVDGHYVFRFTRWKGIEWSFVGLRSNFGAVVTARAFHGGGSGYAGLVDGLASRLDRIEESMGTGLANRPAPPQAPPPGGTRGAHTTPDPSARPAPTAAGPAAGSSPGLGDVQGSTQGHVLAPVYLSADQLRAAIERRNQMTAELAILGVLRKYGKA